MSVTIHRTGCCGFRIIRGLDSRQSAKSQMLHICARMYRENLDCAFAMFSDNSADSRNALALKRFILKNRLGTVKESFNGNTKVWIWEVNNRSAERWFDKNI